MHSTETEFNWSEIFKKNPTSIPAPACLFTEQQHEGMCSTKPLLSKYFPASGNKPQYPLACKFLNNPRTIWQSIKNLTQNDLTEIFSKIGCFKILKEEVKKIEFLTTIPPLVLLPMQIDEKFINHPSINYLSNDLIVQVSCLHREQIKLEGQTIEENTIITCLPHLLSSQNAISLKEKNLTIGFNYLSMLLITCLDLAKSKVSENCFN